jgi:hypothetical protein
LRYCRRPPIDLHLTQGKLATPVTAGWYWVIIVVAMTTHLEKKNLFSYQQEGNILLLKYGTCDTEITSDAED